MRFAIVGSRDIEINNIGKYLFDCEEIISGGAKGVDACAAAYARENAIKLIEIFPQYKRYGRAATIIRNQEIVDSCDCVLVFWNGKSKGTLSVIKYAEKTKKTFKLVFCFK